MLTSQSQKTLPRKMKKKNQNRTSEKVKGSIEPKKGLSYLILKLKLFFIRRK